MVFDSRKFHYFTVLSQERSVSKAAEKLFISQPSMSKFLSQLESDMGTLLFDRTVSPMVLTPAGDKFLEYIGHASRMYEQYMRAVVEVDRDPMGELHVGMGPWRSSFLVNKVFPGFQSEYPSLRLVLHEEPNMNLRQMLTKRQLDLAITVHTSADEVQAVAPASELVIRERLLMVLSKRNPLASLVDFSRNSLWDPQPLDLRLLARRRLISGKPGQRINDDIRILIQQYDLCPSEVIETINMNTAIGLAVHNFGVAFIPESYLLESPFLDQLVFFYAQEPLLTWLVAAEYNSGFPGEPERKFVRLLKKAYAEAGAMVLGE